ncbi:hypothetical protein KQ945_12420 [Bacillus subtilis subsp. subtilis]|nr:hypothetical protein [Bacillus subtilis subsp. subtilis]
MLGKSTVLGCAALLVAGFATALTVVAETPPPGRGIELRKADNGDLMVRRLVVQTRSQWQQWLASPASATSPFAQMDPQRQAAFSRSLVFRDGALTNYDYEILLPFFAAADAYQALGVFGLEHELAFLPGVRVETAADRYALQQANEILAARQDRFAMTEFRRAVAAEGFQPAQQWPHD